MAAVVVNRELRRLFSLSESLDDDEGGVYDKPLATVPGGGTALSGRERGDCGNGTAWLGVGMSLRRGSSSSPLWEPLNAIDDGGRTGPNASTSISLGVGREKDSLLRLLSLLNDDGTGGMYTDVRPLLPTLPAGGTNPELCRVPCSVYPLRSDGAGIGVEPA